MLQASQFLATLCAALFAGAALYINVAEHPARMGLEADIAAMQWATSYRRATWLQAPLAVLGFVAGSIAWLQGGGVAWLAVGALLGCVVPFTFAVIMPTNRALLAPGRDVSSSETRALLTTWGHLHAVRTVLALAATVLALGLLVGA